MNISQQSSTPPEGPFLRSICDSLGDSVSLQIYGDWLEEQGDRSAYLPRLLSESLFRVTTEPQTYIRGNMCTHKRLTSDGLTNQYAFEVIEFGPYSKLANLNMNCNYSKFNCRILKDNQDTCEIALEQWLLLFLLYLSKNYLVFVEPTIERIYQFHTDHELKDIEQYMFRNPNYLDYVLSSRRVPLLFLKVEKLPSEFIEPDPNLVSPLLEEQ